MVLIHHSSFIIYNSACGKSLLCWIGYKNQKEIEQASQQEICFNPCYVGLGIRTWSQALCLYKEGLFQSLLCWIGYKNGEIWREKSPVIGVSILVMLDWV